MVAQTQPERRSRKEPVLTPNALRVLEARYLRRNEAGECIETPGELFHRVAKAIADVELTYGASETERQAWEDRFYELMASGKLMPNSPTLMNAGREMGLLSACFVLPVKDSIEDIFNAIKYTALIQKAGGGTGFAFDELRPTGDYIASSGGTTSGPISFWRAFSEATNAIQQGAFRRGANMGMMYIHHPDILKFLHAKQDLSQFTNYNISVKVTDVWMEEFRSNPDSPHVTRNPRTGRAYVIPRDVDIWKYVLRDLIEVTCVEPVAPGVPECYYRSPRLTGPLPEGLRGKVYTKRDIWNIIVNNSWQTGEPGVVFIDRINEHNPTPHLGRIEATNPCGEQPLLPYEACNLGSINLSAFVRNPCTPAAEVDYAALRQTVEESVRFLDNVIDANRYPLPQIEQMCKANRKIGLGVMGFADVLFMLGVAYNSEEGLAWGERLMRFINEEAHASSERLARLRGCFPNWPGSVWQTRYNRPMRNASVTTVAPTGTISIIANCSGGIEPLFSLAFYRNVLRGDRHGQKPMLEANETFRKVAAERGFLSEALLHRLVSEGTLANIPEVPEDVRRVFVCAHDISPEWHVRMQAAFQRHCDASISKTINFPHQATKADVERIYLLAYELGCKGITVYRDRCREGQPMALENHKPRSSREKNPVDPDPPASQTSPPQARDLTAGPGASGDCLVARKELEPADLPEIVSGLRIRQLTPFGNMHVKITVDPRTGRELEIFAQLGKGGDVANSDLEGICRTASLWLRAGGGLRALIKQWEGIGTSLQVPTRTGRIMSLPDGLACALKKYLRAKERVGLRALLLGEVDPAELDAPFPEPHGRRSVPTDRTVGFASPPPISAQANAVSLTQGGGASGASGAGRIHRSVDQAGGNGGQLQLFGRWSQADSLRAHHAALVAKAALASPRRANGGNGNGRRRGVASGQQILVGALTVSSSTARPITELAATTAVGRTTIVSAVQAGSVGHLVSAPATRTRALAVNASQPFDRPPPKNGEPVLRHDHDAAAHYILRCPQCGGALVRQEGCLHCAENCGWGLC